MSANVRFFNGGVPPLPPTGYVSIFVDAVDRHVKQIDSLGGIIDLTKGEGLIGNKTTIVNSVSDLPTAVDGKIPLVAGTVYELGDDIDITSIGPFDVSAGNVVWTSKNPQGATVTYNGTLPLFQGVDASFNIIAAVANCPNATLLDFVDLSSPNTSIVTAVNSNFTCKKYATVDTLLGFISENLAVTTEDGASLTGAGWAIQSFTKFGIFSGSASFVAIDLGSSTTPNIEMENLFVSAPAGAVGVSGLADSGNVVVGGFGTLRDSVFVGGVTEQAGGIDVANDVRWSSRDNSPGIQNSMPGGLVFQRNNAVATVITDITIPVKAAGTFSTKRVSQFSADATGKIIYLGERPRIRPLTITAIVQPVSGNNRSIIVYVAVNGVFVADSGVALSISANDPKEITIEWEELLNEDDELEVFLRNATTLDNVLASSITFKV